MIVGLRVGVESIESTSEIDFFHMPLINQDTKIPIDGSHAQVRKFVL